MGTKVVKNTEEDCCVYLCVDDSKPEPTCSQQDPDTGEATCLFVCDGIVPADDAVGPCGAFGFVDVTTLKNNLKGCAGDPSYHVIPDFDTNFFSNVYLDGTVLHWVTAAEAPPARYSSVRIRVICKNSDGKKLSYVFCVSIGIKDLCNCVVCDDKCEECDPCTGDCVDNGTGSISIK